MNVWKCQANNELLTDRKQHVVVIGKCSQWCMEVNVSLNVSIATLGTSWNFSLAENLASLSLQDGPLSGIIS